MIWERRSYSDGSGVRCTVKFRGHIAPWGDTVTALGVEWDDPHRGKNNGDIDGVQYFIPRVPNSCSFIRETRPTEKSVSFADAVTSKYLQHINPAQIQLSTTKFVETYGFDKVERLYADLPSLNFISVDSSLVKTLYWPDFMQFTSLEKLDLGNNLIERFSDVLTFLHKFPSLKSVRLSGNRFLFDHENIDLQSPCTSIQSLEMADTALIDDEAEIVFTKFPSVLTISLAGNYLTKIPSNISPLLTELDMADNSALREIGRVPLSVRRASFRGTSVKTITVKDRLPRHCDLRRTQLLREDETGSTIIDWNSVSQIACQNVEELDLLGAFNRAFRGYIIARCGNLKKLDGTDIEPTARLTAEKNTLVAVLKKEHPSIPEDRWKELVNLHGLPYLKTTENIEDRLISFYINDHPYVVRTLGDAPIFRLQELVARLTHQDMDTMEIEGITDTDNVVEDRSAELWQIRDVITDGERLHTYTSAES